MFMLNFSSLACTQTDLDQFLTIFEENFSFFQENSLANSLKFLNLSISFYTPPSKAWARKISALKLVTRRG
jgi:hypothetical protein